MKITTYKTTKPVKTWDRNESFKIWKNDIRNNPGRSSDRIAIHDISEFRNISQRVEEDESKVLPESLISHKESKRKFKPQVFKPF